MYDHKDFEYSIVVKQHYKHKRKGCGHGILVSIRLEGVYEDTRNVVMFKEKKEAIYDMSERIRRMTLPRYGEDGV